MMKHQKRIDTALTVCVLLLSLAGCAFSSTSAFDGSSMEITGDGGICWHIGAEGGSGTHI